MDNELPIKEFELICAIVHSGAGSKVLKIAKLNGINGGTIFLGNGTIKNRILEIFDLCDISKEIVVMVTEKTVVLKAMDAISQALHLHKSNHGIVFSLPVASVYGLAHNKCTCAEERKEEGISVYKAIFVVVEKGKAEDVMDAATKAGARGGTIINARGSGIHETKKIFSMDIEPEKEFILILAESEITDAITTAIRTDLKIDEPGQGVIFVQNVNNAYGLY